MQDILNNKNFREDFERLHKRTLNPRRHTAPNAGVHSVEVAEQAQRLAEINGLKERDIKLMRNLGYVHDIGKITGTANPAKSVELLERYDITDPHFIELVKYHDTALPWYRSEQRGKPVSEKAWKKLAFRVNMKMLCLFMVADRFDCPGGWRANRPTVWFLENAQKRGYLPKSVRFYTKEQPARIYAGVIIANPEGRILVEETDLGRHLPTRSIVFDQTAEDAARILVGDTIGATQPNLKLCLEQTLTTEDIDGPDPTSSLVHWFRLMQQGSRSPSSGKVWQWESEDQLPHLLNQHPMDQETECSGAARAL